MILNILPYVFVYFIYIVHVAWLNRREYKQKMKVEENRRR
uniref:Uncharacterized protein n=1 Tax=Lepeophtheirus salmonis TaxID=72036 RepID=A0A0K2UQ95_LEPSM